MYSTIEVDSSVGKLDVTVIHRDCLHCSSAARYKGREYKVGLHIKYEAGKYVADVKGQTEVKGQKADASATVRLEVIDAVLEAVNTLSRYDPDLIAQDRIYYGNQKESLVADLERAMAKVREIEDQIRGIDSYLRAIDNGIKTYQITEELSIPEEANRRYASMTRSEYNSEGRHIGGDKGDLFFQGYTVEDGKTVLTCPVLRTADILSPQDAYETAKEVLMASYDSVGVETVEHS